jgi:hypothetical protein
MPWFAPAGGLPLWQNGPLGAGTAGASAHRRGGDIPQLDGYTSAANRAGPGSAATLERPERVHRAPVAVFPPRFGTARGTHFRQHTGRVGRLTPPHLQPALFFGGQHHFSEAFLCRKPPPGESETHSRGYVVQARSLYAIRSGCAACATNSERSEPACLQPLSRCSAPPAQTDRLLNHSSREVPTRPPPFQTSLSSGQP